MKNITLSAGALTLAASTAFAGGIDRSGQWITPIFDSGDTVSFSVGIVDPTAAAPALGTSDVLQTYNSMSFSIKKSISDKVDVAIIADQPLGASVKYVDGPAVGGGADITSKALTFVGRYKFNSNFSVHAGLRTQSISGTIISSPGILAGSSAYSWGGLVGAAYERPDIAMRIALTYNTAITNKFSGVHNFATPVTADFKSPESLNLEFQTGIAADTLLFGSVRYAKWGGRSIDTTPVGGGAATNWVTFNDNVTTYSLGVGRKLNDKLSVAVTLGYEGSGQSPGTSLLAPTNGYKSIGIGATYAVNDQLDITGGLQYVKAGSQTVPPFEFNDNKVIGAGFKIKYKF